MRKSTTAGAAALMGGLTLITGAGSAFANNTATVSGATPVINQTVANGCTQTWNAESVYSTDAAKYPAGTLTENGQPVSGGAAGGNGGYIKEVSTDLDANAPGVFKIDRFSSGATDLQARMVVASKYAAGATTYTVTLPKLASGAGWTLTDQGDTTVPDSTQDPQYAGYNWSNARTFMIANNAVNADGTKSFGDDGTGTFAGGTFTFTYPGLHAKQGIVFQFSANNATADDTTALTDYTMSSAFDYASCNLATPTTTTVTTPGTPATMKVTHVAGTPAVYKSVPKTVMALVQDDIYLDHFQKGSYLHGTRHALTHDVALAKAQITTRDKARAADKAAGKLVFEKGSASTWLWGSVSSTVHEVNLCGTSAMPMNADRWVIQTGKGATARLPWGKGGKIAQLVAKADCTPAKVLVTPAVPAHDVTTVVPATPPVTKTVTAYQCVFPNSGATTQTVAEGTGCLDAKPAQRGGMGG